MAWAKTQPADATTIKAGGAYIRDNNAAIEACIGAARLAAGTAIVDPIPGGNTFKIWIYADVAPSGWTIDATPSDELLAIKGGSTYTTGAATAGTWTQPDHTLTTAETPAHTHATGSYTDGAGGGSRTYFSTSGTGSAQVTGSTGGGTAHSHGTTYRPKARVGIICSAD